MEMTIYKPFVSIYAWRHLLSSMLVITLGVCIILQMLGVQLHDVARYVLYICVVVFAPGVALLHGLTREKSNLLRLICVGAGLGYCLEGLVFIVLSALHLREAWALYPTIGIVSILRLLWYWRRAACRTCIIIQDNPSVIWIKAVSIGVIAIIYITGNAYLGVFSYGSIVAPDLLLHLSTAAEIKHHWPVTDPRLAGFPFSYHYLTHIHIAAASLITGINLKELLFQLYLLPLLILVALNTFLITNVFTRSSSIHLLALAMVFFSGIVSLALFSVINFSAFFSEGPLPPLPPLGDPWISAGSSIFSGGSPSLIYGFVLFLPLVFETVTVINKGFCPKRDTIIIGLLVAGCMLAKGSFMPVFVTGLMLAAIWLRMLGNKQWLNAIKIVGLSLALCIPIYFLFFNQYWHSGSPQPQVVPFAIVKETDIWAKFEPVLRSIWASGGIKNTIDYTYRGIALLFASIIIAIYFFVSYGTHLLGIGFYFYRHGWKMPSNIIVLICLVLGGFLPSYLIALIDDNQMHFFTSVYPVLCIIGALGLGQLIFNANAKASRLILQVSAISMLFISIMNSLYPLWVCHKKNIDAGAMIRSAEFLKSSDVYAAQRWIESNTSTNAVIAVNLFADEAPELSRRCDYSAFAERRMFLEGDHSQRGRDPNELFFRRKLLVDVFRNGNVSSLKLLREQYKVTHLVVDNSDGVSVKLPDEALTPIFKNGTVKIYSINNSSDSL